jgi:hypothetical protein
MSDNERLITQPPKARYLSIPHEYFAICQREKEITITRGDRKGEKVTTYQTDEVAAALLYFFERWTIWRIKERKETGTNGLWLFFAMDQIREYEFGGAFGTHRLNSAIDLLMELKFLERRTNPNKGYDRTYQYRFMKDAIQDAVNSLPPFFNIEEWKIQKRIMQSSKPENAISETEEAIPHDPEHDPKQKEQPALATKEQPAKPEQVCDMPASADNRASLSKFGYTIGDTAWLVEDSDYHRVPTIHEVKIARFTKHMIEIEYIPDDVLLKKMRRPHTLSKTKPKLERKTTPIQDALAECLFGIPLDAPIGRRTMIDLQTYAGEITTPYPSITPEQVRAAFAWKGEFKPSKPSMVVKMLGDYRDYLVKTRPSNGASEPKVTFIHVESCPTCTYGMVVNEAGHSVQCPECAESREKEIA